MTVHLRPFSPLSRPSKNRSPFSIPLSRLPRFTHSLEGNEQIKAAPAGASIPSSLFPISECGPKEIRIHIRVRVPHHPIGPARCRRRGRDRSAFGNYSVVHRTGIMKPIGRTATSLFSRGFACSVGLGKLRFFGLFDCSFAILFTSTG